MDELHRPGEIRRNEHVSGPRLDVFLDLVWVLHASDGHGRLDSAGRIRPLLHTEQETAAPAVGELSYVTPQLCLRSGASIEVGLKSRCTDSAVTFRVTWR